MSSTPSLRRSTRTVAPKVVFTIDNQVSPKRKKVAPPSPVIQKPVVHKPVAQKPLVQNTKPVVIEIKVKEPVKMDVPVFIAPTPQPEPMQIDTIPRTTYSNQNIATVQALRRQDRQMTVKQLLARNFTNYKVRPSMTSERAVALVNRTLSENDVPLGALLSGPPQIPNNVVMGSIHQRDRLEHSLQSSLASLVKQAKVPEAPQKPTQTLKAALESLVVSEESHTEAEQGLEDVANQILSSTPKGHDLEPIAYPGNHLPWKVIWKQVPDYKQGEIYCYVGDCTYTPMSAIVKSGNFMIPMTEPVTFVYEGKEVHLTLEELLQANGVNLSPNTLHYRMLQGLLQKAGVHMRADYATRLHELQAVKDRRMSKEEIGQEPIQLTPEQPPLICIHPDIYMRTLGKRIHGAVIVDTSGDREPLPGQTFLTTVYSEPLPFDQRRQILCFFDTDHSIQEITEKFGCTRRTVQETIGTRILIDRQIIHEHLLEYPDSPSTPDTITASSSSSASGQKPTLGEMMRPKSKIRRTHYVDLNKLVWKHFKDCQAAGVQINGKNLKDQAMRYAKEMGK
uniref:HTH_38 domain-containing protein n=1 Tax=Caenorhabditis tropicalis TaxID=1561998 RepID=A0A1I7UYN5_9PELO